MRPFVVRIGVVAFTPVDEFSVRHTLVDSPRAAVAVRYAAVFFRGSVAVFVVCHRHVVGILLDDRLVGTGSVKYLSVMIHARN